MPETYFIVPESQHNALVEAVYRGRGFLADEAADGPKHDRRRKGAAIRDGMMDRAPRRD